MYKDPHVYIYNSVKTFCDLQWCLFSRSQCNPSRLSPTSSLLKYQIFCAHYIAQFWKQCGKPLQNPPHSQSCGCELEENRLLPIHTDKLPAHIGLIKLIMCSGKGLCDISYYGNKPFCTDMCKCLDNFENTRTAIVVMFIMTMSKYYK